MFGKMEELNYTDDLGLLKDVGSCRYDNLFLPAED